MAGMTAQLAKQLMDAGIEKAAKDFGRPICLSVCDLHGDLVAFFRMDGAPLRTISIAQQKAYSAARMGSTTEAFLARLRNEQVDISYFCDPLLTALPGASPVKDKEGRIIGAVGISGLLPSEDQGLAEYLAQDALT
jgi:glc operon protein GlcG